MRIIVLLIAAFVYLIDAHFRCKNLHGEDVDWFVGIKLPANVDERKGRSFVYYDSSQTGWVMSEPANKHGRGHSKGVAVFTIDSGFWLVHSVPNFPPREKYDYPETGTKYAQSFLCLSLDADALVDLSHYMRHSQVTPYITNLPKNFEIIAPYLVDVVNRKSLGRADTRYTTAHDFETRGHMRVKAFAKHKKFGQDLWHDFIALYLRTPMAVETWRNGAAKNVGTQCDNGENVYDIDSVKVLDKVFASSKDHSKWGVSMNENVPAVCIGDVNRQVSQFKRGGGAVCIEDKTLWKTFNGSVNSYLDCGKTINGSR
ncbi:deoxyribonuclease II [Cooperia oncophora]